MPQITMKEVIENKRQSATFRLREITKLATIAETEAATDPGSERATLREIQLCINRYYFLLDRGLR